MARILLVDDNASMLSALGQGLRDLGHLVTSTNNGGDALCLLSGATPDLLLLDIAMPGIDGHEVIRHLAPSKPPVIVISGSMLDADKLDVTKVVRVLHKPFDLSQLLGVIDSILSPAGGDPAPGDNSPLSAQAARGHR